MVVVFFFKQKTAYEMRISDWSSDVCSSDLALGALCRSADVLGLRASAQRKLPCPLARLSLRRTAQPARLVRDAGCTARSRRMLRAQRCVANGTLGARLSAACDR